MKIENDYTHVPETIKFYNKIKFEIDVVDQMVRKTSVRIVQDRSGGLFKFFIIFQIW